MNKSRAQIIQFLFLPDISAITRVSIYNLNSARRLFVSGLPVYTDRVSTLSLQRRTSPAVLPAANRASTEKFKTSFKISPLSRKCLTFPFRLFNYELNLRYRVIRLRRYICTARRISLEVLRENVGTRSYKSYD
ncbi:hypothetical protein PUN28_014234 [Cardiocondyla obscurior]|uniref:Uncharacterized protein n=1 Tax=Cardiocondyla obscurior TaxID=286306 RepID=A0AAW2F2T4_9HYME